MLGANSVKGADSDASAPLTSNRPVEVAHPVVTKRDKSRAYMREYHAQALGTRPRGCCPALRTAQAISEVADPSSSACVML